MADRPVVVRSINEPGGVHCVDVLSDGLGEYRFRFFRRDPEDPRGWYPTGPASIDAYPTAAAALAAARQQASWVPVDGL